jgi:hypothetical protein
MDRYSDVVINENGHAVPRVSIQILDQISGLPAIIYADRDGNRQENPFLSDDLGRWSFCAPDGLYEARIYMGGVLKARLPDIRIEEPGGVPAELTKSTGAQLVGTLGGSTVQADLTALRTSVSGLSNYTLPPASAVALGGIKVGNGLAVGTDGTLNATGLTPGTVGSVNGVNPTGGNVLLTTDNLQEPATTPTNLWFTPARVLASVLTGLSVASGAAVTAADTILAAIGKLQAQATTNAQAIQTNASMLSQKDASNGYAGLAGFAINLKNAAGSVLSTIASAATAARTWTFPDKSGTVAMLSDIPAMGSMMLIGQTTVSTAVSSIDFLSLFTSTYDKYVIEIQGLTASTAGGLLVRLANAGTVDSAANYYGFGASGSAPTAGTALGTGSINVGTTAATALTATFDIRNANSAANKSAGLRGAAGTTSMLLEGSYTGAAVSGFRLLAGGGNFTAGKIIVYGIKNS